MAGRPPRLTDPARAARWQGVASLVAVWAAVSLMFVPQALVINASRPQPAPVGAVLAGNAAIFVLWTMLTPLVMALARRWPLDRGRVAASLWRHMVAAVVVALAHVAAMTALHWPFLGRQTPPFALFVNVLAGLGATNVLMYGAVVAAGHARAYLDRYRAGERARADARLAALRAQLQPHFLFNTLNALAELVHRDPPLAERLVLRLSDLLRRTLATGEAHEVTLAEELAFCRAYLDIQSALMGPRLQCRIDVPASLDAARVPTMLLQPLVENAIRHGLAPSRSGGAVTISAHEADGNLHVVVRDDGLGGVGAADGIGLRNTRARLRTLYGDEALLEAGAASPRGWIVHASLPLRLQGDPA